jgi:hypothetical protein
MIREIDLDAVLSLEMVSPGRIRISYVDLLGLVAS